MTAERQGEQTGAGTYQIEFVAPSYAVPEPYLGPLAVLAFVFPLGAILLSWREYRFTRDTVDMASTLLVWLWRTAIGGIFLLIIWILASRSLVGMLYWPPRLEYVLYYSVLFASGAMMVFFMFLWRRQALIATLDREMQRRRAAQEELERSNRDLEMFAYVASHDMKQPLRMVKFYTQRLKDKYKGKLDADADEFIDFAAGNAERMEQLLQGLLEYSRVDSTEVAREEVDLDELVANTRQKLQLLLVENKGKLTSGPLGTIKGNYTQMSQLFQNLAENAIKYRSKAAPRVHFERVGDTIRCIDNGRGIPEKDQARVFKLFKRLDADDGGEGIGLALCLRIVEKHGGTIRARTNPEGGTIMEFTIGS
ncbi:MAG: sensor histidine kinase [Thermoplasmatota archaeon]